MCFFQVVENIPTPITQADLSFQDADTPPSQLVYNVTEHPKPGQGMLVNTAQPTVPVQQFTQHDLNQNVIVYRPPLLDATQTEAQFSFKFIGECFHYNSLCDTHVQPFIK